MIILPAGAAAAANVEVPLTLVNSGLSLANQTTTATFEDLEYGAPAGANRFVIACFSAEEATSGSINLTSVSWGGTSLSQIEAANRSSGGVAILAEIWAGFVTSGNDGDLVVGLNKSASSTENFDSIGVSTLVTNVIESETPVDTDTDADSGDEVTVSNLQTSSGGFVVGLICTTADEQAIDSLTGNGTNGALTEMVDVGMQGDHRHALYMLDGTTAQSTEDFTSTSDGTPLSHVLAMASWL